MYQQTGGEAPEADMGAGTQSKPDDNVVDAEYTEVNKDK
jgi:hypothetical protein